MSVLKIRKSSLKILNVYTKLSVKKPQKKDLSHLVRSGVSIILLLSIHGKTIGVDSLSISNLQQVYVNSYILLIQLNRQISKGTKNEGVSPTDTALEKFAYLACRNIRKKWFMLLANWGTISQQLAIKFEERFKLL